MLGGIRRQLMHDHANALRSRNGQLQRRSIDDNPSAHKICKVRKLSANKLGDRNALPLAFGEQIVARR